MDIEKTLQEFVRADFLENLYGTLADARYFGDEWQTVKNLIPDNSNEVWNQLHQQILDYARECSTEELESIIRQMPAGYARSNVRTIWRERTGS